MNRRTTETLFDGRIVTYSYTATGMRASATDERGTTSYAYDPLDRLIGISVPGDPNVGYTYDAVGNRLSLTSAAGTTQYAYDEVGRLTTVTDPQRGLPPKQTSSSVRWH
jgi:YD repeat-containing protein